ncbi:hypothetical protein [Phycicoccus sp. 3266]|uniref:hypothetical protein n=1 Tax=Phycicoccus sp. 3266 TaxID=2817751 RepID=UPI002856197E|nr:hypothetical protein [Phycicoccus sp. 3266]MDR6863499.1 hypothetical protein [Phycicoccus sp. 3266]
MGGRLDEVLVRPRRGERSMPLPGDELVPDAAVVMDRGFTLPAPPADVWPWFVQLGRRRGGWYLPGWLERVVPPRRRALRHLDPALLGLAVGDVIPDWGGHDATFTVAELAPGSHLVHTSRRGAVRLSWCIALRPTDAPLAPGTRVHLRLRLGGVRRPWVGEVGGGALDLLTVAGLAAGLRERLLAGGGSTGGAVGGRA